MVAWSCVSGKLNLHQLWDPSPTLKWFIVEIQLGLGFSQYSYTESPGKGHDVLTQTDLSHSQLKSCTRDISGHRNLHCFRQRMRTWRNSPTVRSPLHREGEGSGGSVSSWYKLRMLCMSTVWREVNSLGRVNSVTPILFQECNSEMSIKILGSSNNDMYNLYLLSTFYDISKFCFGLQSKHHFSFIKFILW